MKTKIITAVLILSFFSSFSLIAQRLHGDNGDGTYTNPVIAADFPDPDGDNLSYLWFNYPEAGSYKKLIKIDSAENARSVYVIAPEVEKKETVHFILKVTDKSNPPLSRYKRVIVNIIPK